MRGLRINPVCIVTGVSDFPTDAQKEMMTVNALYDIYICYSVYQACLVKHDPCGKWKH